MASQHKVVYNFRPALAVPSTSNSVNGWTETFYVSSADADQTCMAKAKTVLAARRGLLTRGWRCNKIRVYQWPFSRQSQPFTPLAGDQIGFYPAGGVAPIGATDEQAYDVLIQDIVCAAGRTRAWGMRGIGSDVVDAGSAYLAPPVFVATNNSFRDALVTAGFAVRTQTAAGQNPITGASIAGALGGVAATPFSPAVSVAGIPTALVVGDKIRISGVLGFVGLNGVWSVATAQAPVLPGASQIISLKAKRGRQVIGSYVGAGTITVLTFALSAITDMNPTQGSSHRVGGLPGRLRGRRKRPV